MRAVRFIDRRLRQKGHQTATRTHTGLSRRETEEDRPPPASAVREAATAYLHLIDVCRVEAASSLAVDKIRLAHLDILLGPSFSGHGGSREG